MKIVDGRDPAVDYRRINELAEEFTRHWKKLQAFYLDAVVGFNFVRGHVEAEQTLARSFIRGSELDSEEFQDTLTFTYAQIFSDGFCTSAIHEATQGEVKARNSLNGENFNTLGQVCITSFYDFWEDYLRREYAIAKGLLDRNERRREVVEQRLREHASHDLWGDIYYLRTSIVHNQGNATSDVAKCKLIKWFAEGDAIALSPVRMRSVFLGLLAYRNELFGEQFPKRYIQL